MMLTDQTMCQTKATELRNRSIGIHFERRLPNMRFGQPLVLYGVPIS